MYCILFAIVSPVAELKLNLAIVPFFLFSRVKWVALSEVVVCNASLGDIGMGLFLWFGNGSQGNHGLLL